MLRRMDRSQACILVVEDEAAIADTVLYALRSEGYPAEHCLLGLEALQRAAQGDVALLVLDVGLPDLSGFEVCRRLRAAGDPAVAALPVILLTARSDEVDRVLGLELGADDYVAKPFSPRELVARVRARLRRHVPAGEGGQTVAGASAWRVHGAFAIDEEGHRIRYAGALLDLTRYEYGLLAALLQRPGAILSRAQLMDRGWDADVHSLDRTVDTHVKTLRGKLRAAGAVDDPIRTHRGLGYALAP